jgi:type I restriction enzyme S subunit
MKVLRATNARLAAAGRWDLDYHLPPELIERYPPARRRPIFKLAHISKRKRDPSKDPDRTFLYVDISSVDVQTGAIANPQELSGEEAPSRARMVISAYDVLVSTCRPTRGAIAVVPPDLHNQICSTGFAVLRCSEEVNPFFLHYVLRLPSTLEQFRKLSTGSSYPAILDTDVLETIVPHATPEEQNAIAASTVTALERWRRTLREANDGFKQSLADAETVLQAAQGDTRAEDEAGDDLAAQAALNGAIVSTAAIREALCELETSVQAEDAKPDIAPQAQQTLV